jgi:hypothetical protein
MSPPAIAKPYVNKPPAMSFQSRQSSEDNRLVLVVTHPKLDDWHRSCIQNTLGDFVPLDEDDDLPVLKPLDPTTIMSFDQLSQVHRGESATFTLRVETDGTVKEIIYQIVLEINEFLCTST